MSTQGTPEFNKEIFAGMLKYFALVIELGWTDDEIVSDLVAQTALTKEGAQKALATARKMYAPYQRPPNAPDKSVVSPLIDQLRSPNKNKRYDACEELRVSASLPEEALTALEDATHDPDLDVAEAAKRALETHRSTPDVSGASLPFNGDDFEPATAFRIGLLRRRQKAKNRMVIGALMLASAACVTLLTYQGAQSSAYGGTYYICYGAMIWGGVYLLWGLVDWMGTST